MLTIKWNGKPVSVPGVYADIDLAKYHGADICVGPSISSSGLRRIFSESPAHYWVSSPLNPKCIEEKPSEAMILGHAAHHLLLAEADFRKLFVVRPDTLGGEKWQGNRKACKIWLEQRAAENLIVVTGEQIERIKGMATSLARHPLVSKGGILNGEIERSFIWRDKETTVWCKARPDAMPTDSADFADPKTTASVNTDYLQRAIAEHGYHQQAAMVGEGCQQLLGIPMATFSLVFIESKPPYCVRVVTLKDGDLERGKRANRSALRTFAACMKSGKWPGPGGDQEDAIYLELPAYAQVRIDTQLELEGA